eukprot:3333178-Pleurochrysis_carterae.AAC.1
MLRRKYAAGVQFHGARASRALSPRSARVEPPPANRSVECDRVKLQLPCLLLVQFGDLEVRIVRF